MTQDSSETSAAATATRWKSIVARYQRASHARANWQVVNTLGPYAILWCLMSLSVSISWWLTVPLALLAAGFLARIFIIFHDCGHGSFYKSRAANRTLGFITGLLTFTPYHHWRWQHALHHRTCGDLDRRGMGDIWTMTVREYLESSRWRRFSYRLVRNPIVLFVIAPVYLFVIHQRFPAAGAPARERRSVHWMNLAVLAMAGGMSALLGFKTYLLIQLGVTTIAGAAGIWLFYVQHQFESAYWRRSREWSYTDAALQGSSYYKLPRILQWFSGNIGFHHIHHLCPRIANYNLQKCHEADPLFTQIQPLTLLASLRSLAFRLWDEQSGKLVGFRGIGALSTHNIGSAEIAAPGIPR